MSPIWFLISELGLLLCSIYTGLESHDSIVFLGFSLFIFACLCTISAYFRFWIIEWCKSNPWINSSFAWPCTFHSFVLDLDLQRMFATFCNFPIMQSNLFCFLLELVVNIMQNLWNFDGFFSFWKLLETSCDFLRS